MTGRRSIRALLYGVLMSLALAAPVAAQPPYNNLVEFNGAWADRETYTNADGLYVKVGGGQYSIYRNGMAQVYEGGSDRNTASNMYLYNNVVLVAEDLFFMSSKDDDPAQVDANWRRDNTNQRSWTSVTTELTKSGPTDWQAVTTLTADANGKLYTLVVTSDYRRPQFFVDVTYELTIPDGAGPDVHLYQLIDMYLDTYDNGPVLSRVTGGRRMVVQYSHPAVDEDADAVGGLREIAGYPYDSYVADDYACVVWGKVDVDCIGSPNGPGNYDGTGAGPKWYLSDNIAGFDPDDDSDWVDTAVGGHWNIGNAAGLHTRRTQLFFAPGSLSLANAFFEDKELSTGQSTNLLVTLDGPFVGDGVSGLGMVYQLPEGGVYGTPTSDCGATLSVSNGQLSISGVDLAQLEQCIITVPTTFNIAGTYRSDDSHVVSKSGVLENGLEISEVTVTGPDIVEGPPVCELTPDMAVSPQFIELVPGGTATIEVALRNLCNDRPWRTGDVLLSLSDGITVIEVPANWLNLGQRAAIQQFELAPGETVRYLIVVKAADVLPTAPLHISELYSVGRVLHRIDGVFLTPQGLGSAVPVPVVPTPDAAAPVEPAPAPALPSSLPNTGGPLLPLGLLAMLGGAALVTGRRLRG